MLLSLPTIGARARDIMRAVAPSAVAAAIMAATVLFAEMQFLSALSAPARLVLLVPLGAAIYIGLSWRFQRHTIDDLIGFVRKRKTH